MGKGGKSDLSIPLTDLEDYGSRLGPSRTA
ncbi:hypothetical protein SALBM135S_09076 [Streptomyces alboniger]